MFKKSFFVFVILVFFIPNFLFSQTVLKAGDLVFLGINADGPASNHVVSVLFLVDVAAGTEISFTDIGWDSVNSKFKAGLGLGDYFFRYTIGTAVNRGTIRKIALSFLGHPRGVYDPVTIGVDERKGDQLFAFQGGWGNPRLITGLTTFVDSNTSDNLWDGSATSLYNSGLPSGLSNGDTAIRLHVGTLHKDNWQFNCNLMTGGETISGKPVDIRAAVYNVSNWDSSNTVTYDPKGNTSCSYNVYCEAAVLTSFSTIENPCYDQEITITIVGDLNEATEWQILKGSCSGTTTVIGTTSSNTFSFNITESNTYAVRPSGGCAFSGSPCFEKEIKLETVKPIVKIKNNKVELGTDGKASITVSDINNGSSDNCSIATMSLDITEFECSNLGDNTVILTIKDSSGNVQTKSAQVTVEDKILPVAIAQNITVHLDATGNVSITPADVNNGSTDNCAIASMSLNKTSFDCTNLGVNTVILTVKDASGNSNVATVTVTVKDTIPPSIIAKDISVYISADGSVTVNPSDVDNGSADNCGIASRSLSKTTFSCGDIGENTVIFSVEDSTGNTLTANVKITVFDALKPTVKTKNITVELGTDGKASITVSDINNGSSDNCSIATMSLDITEFECSNLGDNTVILTIKDTSGNVQTKSAQVAVEDKILPVAIAQNITVHLDATGNVSITPADVNNGSTDNCAIASMSLNKTSFDCTNLGVNTVILTVKDASGNSNVATVTVTVKDTIPPSIIAKDISVYISADGSVTVNPSDVDNGSADNCGIASRSLSKTTFSCGDIGENTVIFSVEDSTGNTLTANVKITVFDALKPTVKTKNITVELGTDGKASITVSDINNGSSDNCSIATMSLDITEFECSNLGDNTVILTIEDTSGNVQTKSAQVTVVDEILPVAIAQNITVNLDATGNVSISAAALNNGSSDNCSIASMSLNKTSFDCTNLGVNTVILTVKDTSGNSNVATVTVTVKDAIPPSIIAKDISVYISADGSVTVNPSDVDNGSADNCGIASRSLSKTTFSCGDIGEHTVLFSVEDSTGNTQTENVKITVFDALKPIVKTKNITVELGTDGKASITVSDINNGSSDNCSIATMSLDITEFECSNLGDNTVILTIKDTSGNVQTKSAQVTVEDKILPVAIAQNITVHLDATGNVSITPADVNNGSTDNCTIASMSLNKTSFDCTNLGVNTVILTVKDTSGNSNVATVTVTVKDTIPPSIIAKDISVYISADGSVTVNPSDVDNGSADNCGIASRSLSKTTFSCGDIGEHTVLFSVEDSTGNTQTENVKITVFDALKPIVKTKNISVELGTDGKASIAVSHINNGSSDNCSIATMSLDITEFECSNLGDNTVILTIKDTSGNVQTKSAQVTVVDNIPPAVIAKQNITVSLDGTGKASITPADVNNGSTDNCTIASMSLDKTSFDCSNLGKNQVRLSVQDTAGNSNSVNAIVTVLDMIMPTIQCITDQTVSFSKSCNVSLKDYTKQLTYTDNCLQGIKITQTPVHGTLIQEDTEVVITVTDGSGNTNTCRFMVFTKDTTAPEITCPVNLRIGLNSACNIQVPDFKSVVNVIGFCDSNVSLTQLPKVGTVIDENTKIVITATDDSGNTNSCSFLLIVADVLAPVPAVAILPIVTGVCQASVTDAPLAIDNCQGIIVGTTSSALNFDAQGNYTITWKYDDGVGNIAWQTQKIVIKDQVLPIVKVKDFKVVNAGEDVFISVEDIDNGSSDNCAIKFMKLSNTDFSCYPIGDYAVTLIVEDISGNIEEATAIISIDGDDLDHDLIPDSCDGDMDGDGIINSEDNCPTIPNTDQLDIDNDGIGDVCDSNDLVFSKGFSPNGDGLRDYFIIQNVVNYPKSTLRVYNRNGNLVFKTNQYKNDWNGRLNGVGNNQLPAGAYFYSFDKGTNQVPVQGWVYINY